MSQDRERSHGWLRTIEAAALSKVKGCFIQHSITLLVWNFRCKWSIWTKQERWIWLFCTHWTSTKTCTLFYKLHHNLYFHSWCAQVSIYSPDSSSEPMFVLQENFSKPKVTFFSYFLLRPVLIPRDILFQNNGWGLNWYLTRKKVNTDGSQTFFWKLCSLIDLLFILSFARYS